MKTRRLALMGTAAFVLASGLLGACAPKSDVQPDPNPTSTTVAQDCRTALAEENPGGSLKLSGELLAQTVQTLNSIRNHCKDRLSEYGTSNVTAVTPKAKDPGMSKFGCMKPSFDDNGRLFRPICFVWVPETSAQFGSGDFPKATAYYIVRLGDGKGNFAGTDEGAKESDRAVLFVWRVNIQQGLGSAKALDIMYDANLQVVLFRPVPADGKPADEAKFDPEVQVWRAVAVAPRDKLRNYGSFPAVIKAGDDFARRLTRSQERYARNFLEWDDYNRVAANK